MTTSTATIADFLLARIGEDESVARSFGVDPKGIFENHGGSTLRWYALMQGRAYSEARSRVLAECAAKRVIVAGHANLHVCPNMTDDGYTDYSAADYDDGYQPCPTLRALASVYADHPDYRSEWAS